ncbi:MAG: Eco57I restriction-modification methylase domain-containing protein [Limisphaerales bacterium]
MAQPPPQVLELIQRFGRNREAYRSPHYNETQIRREFLDPFFKALGWDIDNEHGYAEPYKDVVHEDAIRVGEATEAPDYSFRIGGTRKFFLEAKRPSVDIKNDVHPAFQLRRYAWTKGLPLSILSDFEEFAVYDGRFKPHHLDSAAIARVLYIPYTEYASRWDEIAGVFSREAVLTGAFDKFAESVKAKRGTANFDDDFLKTIETWRTDVARNLALRNPKLSQRELNFAVQRIIDRIIFLRICEGRGIEDHGRLRALLNGERVYPRLCQLFEEADTRYNSGLFHFQPEKDRHEAPDELTLNLELDDKLLRDIISGLYGTTPYAFDAVEADILGQIYEQFLGRVIRLTEGHRAVVEEKPEVKKAGGVYYTPTYVVEYIVQATVGHLLENKTPQQAAKLKVLDPACGSGSFLIGAYEHLLKWHRDFYTSHDPAKWAKGPKPVLVQVGAGNWKLTIAERKRILLDNIFGVDIDSQAVETTKLSLLLKVLEGETQQTLQPVLRLFHQRALPDLGGNIKCGNSLLGPDFYQQRQMSLLDDEERYRVNVFDWHAEFPQVFRQRVPPGELREMPVSPLDYTMPGVPLHGRYGYRKQKPEEGAPPPAPSEPEWEGGFDAVIGNPPYVRQESLSGLKAYFETHYDAYDGMADLFAYFMEKAVRLLSPGGRFSFIVSSSFLRASYAEPLRRVLKKNAAVLGIVDFGGLAVFTNAKDTYVCIPLLAKEAQPCRVEVSRVDSVAIRDLAGHVAAHHFTIPHDRLSPEAWALRSDEEAAVFAKLIAVGKPLGDYVEGKFFRGVTSGLNDAFIIDTDTRRRLIAEDAGGAELLHPVLGGEEVRRYCCRQSGRWMIFTRRGVNIDRYPAIRAHLSKWKEDLAPKKHKKAKRGRKPGRYQWYEIQDDVAYFKVFEGPKIIFPDICKGPRFHLDMEGRYITNTAYCLGTGDPYLLGILNSRLFWFAISNLSIPFGIRAGRYRYRLIYQYMERVPIRLVNADAPADQSRRDQVAHLAEQMLALHQRLSAAKTPQEKTALERQITAADTQLDRLVYDLYGLTEKEIEVLEAAAPRERGS